MKVHVLTHTVLEGAPEQVYGLVGEHLDRQREFGAIQAVAIQHGGEIPAAPDEASQAGNPHLLYLDGGDYALEKIDDIIDERECVNLAANCIAAAAEMGRR